MTSYLLKDDFVTLLSSADTLLLRMISTRMLKIPQVSDITNCQKTLLHTNILDEQSRKLSNMKKEKAKQVL